MIMFMDTIQKSAIDQEICYAKSELSPTRRGAIITKTMTGLFAIDLKLAGPFHQ